MNILDYMEFNYKQLLLLVAMYHLGSFHLISIWSLYFCHEFNNLNTSLPHQFAFSVAMLL
jgi:hypothetical protein